MKLHFLGAAGQVTGSRYVLDVEDTRLMIDCGMFQERAHLGRNWERCPLPPASIDAVLLTHAHLDHCGLLPRLVHDGFDGNIYATPPSVDLTRVVLEDAANIQEEDAARKRKRHARQGRQGRFPVVPLYTQADVTRVIPLLRTVPYGRALPLKNGLTATWHDAGHILGSSCIEIAADRPTEPLTLLFSGDLGQHNKPIVRDPTTFRHADVLVMESTYGDREHKDGAKVRDQIAELMTEAVGLGGKLLIPTFAVERAQELIYHMARLHDERRLPDIPVFLDSPMALDVLDIFRRHRLYLDKEANELLARGMPLFDFPGLRLIETRDESKRINTWPGACVVLAGSGMCNAGRIKHHLAHHIGDARTTICFTGYQAEGTLGREIRDGATRVRILGDWYMVQARVREIIGMSAHADRAGLLEWSASLLPSPKVTFLTHGETTASKSLADALRSGRGWNVRLPRYGEVVDLDAAVKEGCG